MREHYSHLKRRLINVAALSLMVVAAITVIVPLCLILYNLLSNGIQALNMDFFTQMPKPVGEAGGGMSNAIVGTLVLLGLANLIGLPIGIFGGLYLAEFKETKLTLAIRFTSDILNGTPSIVIGIFIYTIIVLPMKQFSALAGGVALGIMMIPVVMRTTEEMLKMVPRSLREAGLALGLPYWRVLLFIILKSARSGIITGILLAISRIAGETAPLLFTALGNQFWSTSLDRPIAALPLQIFIYAVSPFDEWQQQAWAGALTLIGLILVLNISARIIVRNRFKRG